MSKLATFAPDVEKAIRDYVSKNPRNPGTEPAESVWGFGFTRDTPRKIFSLDKMFFVRKGVYSAFTIRPGDEPLKFIVKHWTQTGEEKMTQVSKEAVQVASIQDVPAVIREAARKSREQAMALRMERIV